MEEGLPGHREDPPAASNELVAAGLIGRPVGGARVMDEAVGLDSQHDVGVRGIEAEDAAARRPHFVLRDRWRPWQLRENLEKSPLELRLGCPTVLRTGVEHLAQQPSPRPPLRAESKKSTTDVADRGESTAQTVVECGAESDGVT